jgi:hypothetical protein
MEGKTGACGKKFEATGRRSGAKGRKSNEFRFWEWSVSSEERMALGLMPGGEVSVCHENPSFLSFTLDQSFWTPETHLYLYQMPSRHHYCMRQMESHPYP